MVDGEYPEHDKLKSVRVEHGAVEEFIDWLAQNGFWICELADNDKFYPTYKSNAQIIASFFQIDLKKFDQEKDAMLKMIRRSLETVNE